MLIAKKTSAWRGRYDLIVADRTITTWDSSFWKSGGEFDLDGRHYLVRGNMWGSRFGMADESGAPVATADRVGRKHWTVQAGGRTYRFRRASMWSNEQVLLDGDRPVGSIRRPSFWRGDVTVDLPGLPLPVQIFVLGVVITMWNAQAAAAS